MKRIDQPLIERPDGKGIQLEIPNVGVLLTLQMQDDGYVNGNIALHGKPVLVIQFHREADGEWTVHGPDELATTEVTA